MLIKRSFSLFKSKLFMAGMLSLCMANGFSAVIVHDIDSAQEALENATFSINDGFIMITNILDQLADATDFAQQTTDLTQLIHTEQDLANKCNQYCNQEELKKVHDYLDQLNNNFTSQFKRAGDTLTNTNNSIKNVQKLVMDMPNRIKAGRVKIAEVSASIQQASLKAQQEMNKILVRIQEFSIQQEQRRILENKLERANTNSAYAGFHESKL